MVTGLHGALADRSLVPQALAPVPAFILGVPGAGGATFLDCLQALALGDDTRDDEVACMTAASPWPVAAQLPPGAPLPTASECPLPQPPAARATPMPAPATEGSPLRLHLYQDGAGLQAWLGADARVPDAVLRQVQLTLRQALAREGASLARLVCNGQEVDAAAPLPPRRRIHTEGRA